MGNISFIMPVENKQNLNIEIISSLIRNAFPEFTVVLLEIGQIIVSKNDETVCEIWKNDEGCYLLDESDDKIKMLNIHKDDPCLGISYGKSFYLETDRSRVATFLTDHFKGYWFDEGIHPEFITHTDDFLQKYR